MTYFTMMSTKPYKSTMIWKIKNNIKCILNIEIITKIIRKYMYNICIQ